MIWTSVITAVALAVAVGVWLLLCNARARPPGHRGLGRAGRDPHDPIRSDDEEPPGPP